MPAWSHLWHISDLNILSFPFVKLSSLYCLRRYFCAMFNARLACLMLKRYWIKYRRAHNPWELTEGCISWKAQGSQQIIDTTNGMHLALVGSLQNPLASCSLPSKAGSASGDGKDRLSSSTQHAARIYSSIIDKKKPLQECQPQLLGTP